MIHQLRLDIDDSTMFVPGVRRGICPRTGESEAQLQERLRGAMSQVREANVQTNAVGPGLRDAVFG